jgi:hypothetical protein
MKPQSCKAKGRRLQQQIVKHIEEKFKDQLRPGDVRSISMGASGEDIILSPLAADLFPFSVECKNCETLSLIKAYEQSFANGNKSNREPIVVFSKNRCPIYIAISSTHPSVEKLSAFPQIDIRQLPAKEKRRQIWHHIETFDKNAGQPKRLILETTKCDALCVFQFKYWLGHL